LVQAEIWSKNRKVKRKNKTGKTVNVMSDSEEVQSLADDYDDDVGGEIVESREEREGETESAHDGIEVISEQQAEELQAKVVKPKKVTTNPQPKLDADRLLGKRGIGTLEALFKDVKYKGKGYEREDLDLVLKKMEHWAHRLFPRFTFDESIERYERLGLKKPVQTYVKRMRMNMLPNTDTTEMPTDEVDPDVPEEQRPKDHDADLFNEIMERHLAQFPANDQSMSDNDNVGQSIVVKPSGTLVLTDEQKAKIEENRKKAEEKRKLRLSLLNSSTQQQQPSQTEQASTCDAEDGGADEFDEEMLSMMAQIEDGSLCANEQVNETNAADENADDVLDEDQLLAMAGEL